MWRRVKGGIVWVGCCLREAFDETVLMSDDSAVVSGMLLGPGDKKMSVLTRKG